MLLLHHDGHEGARGGDPHPDRHRQQEHERSSRRERAEHAERRDDKERGPDGDSRAVAPQQRRCEWREDAHAEHGDRREQPGDAVRDAERGLDLREQRPDPDDLRPQHEADGEQRQDCR